jgi:hypothetical protein
VPRFWTDLNGTDRLTLPPLVLFNGSIFLPIFKTEKDQLIWVKKIKKLKTSFYGILKILTTQNLKQFYYI